MHLMHNIFQLIQNNNIVELISSIKLQLNIQLKWRTLVPIVRRRSPKKNLNFFFYLHIPINILVA